MRQGQHVLGAGDRHVQGFQRVLAVIKGAGDAGGVNDEIHPPVFVSVPVQRLDDVVLQEGDIFDFTKFFARFAGGDQVVEDDKPAGFILYGLVEVGKDLGEITAEEPAPAG